MRLAFASLATAVALAACGGGSADDPDKPDASDPTPTVDAPPPIDAAVPPVFRNRVELPDAELATQALQLLGADVDGATENCGTCHGMTRSRLRYWRGLSDRAMGGCITDVALTTKVAALQMLDCLRDVPKSNGFTPEHVGIFATNAHLPWFEYVFRLAYEADWAAERDAFLGQVAMPRGEHPAFTQPQFDIVAEWFARGLPALDATLREDPAPSECLASVSADVASHVNTMKTQGWSAANAEAGILMHGCAGAATARDCLAAYPLASSRPYASSWSTVQGGSLRVLRENDYMSSYWTRSSPDGRFIAHGNGSDNKATVIDLAPVGGKLISVSAQYDPGFFPDNSGMVFQTANQTSPARACLMRVLTGGPTAIRFNEPGCGTLANVGLYQHVGRTPGGDDYWAIQGQFVNDDSGTEVGQGGDRPADPAADFAASSTIELTAIVNTGSKFEPREKLPRVPVRFQGDAVLSPSARLIVTRVSGENESQLGYAMHKVEVTGAADDRTAALTEVARYCAKGGKPAFSLDERWMVIHHFVTDADAVELGFRGPDDPAFAAIKDAGSANIYLVDLVTGRKTRITRVGAGQYALFPHFRSDGWIYFIVRDPHDGGAAYREYMVASDAALVLGGR
jgi:hypothetical protein